MVRMSKRFVTYTALSILILGGLFAGLFTGAIQKSLTLPMVEAMMQMGTTRNQARTMAKIVPTATATTQTQVAANLLAQDTFQRANQALWGTASDGRQWGGDANTQQAFSIVGAAGQIAQSQGTLNAVLGPINTNTDVLMSGMVNQFGDGVNFGCVLRWTNGNNFYKALLNGSNLTIIKQVKGQGAQVATVPFKAQGGVVYSIDFRAIGAMLFASAWRSGTTRPANWMIVTTDNSLLSGQAGIRVVVQTATVVNITAFTASLATMGDMS